MKFIWCSTLILLASVGSLSAQTNTFPTSGNVGIGTTTPSTKLEVVGAIKTTDATDSISKTTGGLTVAGGLGLGKSLFLGGVVNAQKIGVTFASDYSANHMFAVTGDLSAAGTTNTSTLLAETTITGVNGPNSASNGIRSNVIVSGTAGTVTNTDGVFTVTRMVSAMNVTTAVGMGVVTQLFGTGNIENYYGLFIMPHQSSSTGDITGVVRGIYVDNVGRGAAATVSGVDVLNQTKGLGDAYAYRGQMTAAAGKYNLYMSGTAANYIAGNVGVGTVDSSLAKLQVAGDGLFYKDTGYQLTASNGSGGTARTSGFNLRIDTTDLWQLIADNANSNNFFIQSRNNSSKRYLTIADSSGNVGIGTPNPTHKLSVNGTIRAKEVIVESTPWPDYVFTSDYKLTPLAEVESHIKEKGHLPGIPSAQEVAEHGVSMGDMQAKLLAKVEELTLHLIAQEKQIAELREQAVRQQAMMSEPTLEK